MMSQSIFNHAAPDGDIHNKIHELEQGLAEKSAECAAALSHIDFVRANGDDVEKAESAAQFLELEKKGIEQQLDNLRRIAGL